MFQIKKKSLDFLGKKSPPKMFRFFWSFLYLNLLKTLQLYFRLF